MNGRAKIKPEVKRAKVARVKPTGARQRTLLPEFAALIAKGPKTDVGADLDAVRGERWSELTRQVLTLECDLETHEPMEGIHPAN